MTFGCPTEPITGSRRALLGSRGGGGVSSGAPHARRACARRSGSSGPRHAHSVSGIVRQKPCATFVPLFTRHQRRLYHSDIHWTRKRNRAQAAEVTRLTPENEWCRGTELNRRHKDFQSSALPTELPRHTRTFGSENGLRLFFPTPLFRTLTWRDLVCHLPPVKRKDCWKPIDPRF